MNPLFIRSLISFIFLLLVGCSDNHVQNGTFSTNAALFDPSTSTVPLPNILATATAKDPLTQYTNPLTGVVGARPANTPMTPPEALAYINKYEVGSTNAVAGLNAPIYIRFTASLDSSTVTSANIKVFQITPDPSGLENNPLTFSDVSGLFTYQYAAGSTDLFLFPNFPLTPGARYLYVVTSRVKDAASGLPVAASTFFDALKSSVPLTGVLAALEPIRANALSGSNIQLSGYAKVMNDLIAASATTTITSKSDISLMGRFITTGAGFVRTDATNAATSIPVESAIRAFSAGALPGKTWTNTVSGTLALPPNTYWSGVFGVATTAPASVASVVTGTINSANLSVDPVVVAANSATMNLTAITGAYNPAAGFTQFFRSGANLAGFYHTASSVPFVYIAPVTPNGEVVIFQHGITGQKEQVVAVAQSLTSAGYAVVAIDLPMHGALAIPGHTSDAVWGQDFMAVGAPLATRSNIQQGALNLNRLEITLKTGGFVGVAGTVAPPTKVNYVSTSLGSIIGAYYLAGNTTNGQTPIAADMKGFMSVPGGRLAYLIKDSPAFGPSVNAGLAAIGIAAGTPTYNQFFQVTQSVVDPADPATMTSPLASGLPSRLSGRLAVQEAIGDLVIPNANTRYFGNALGGRGILNTAAALAVAPNFSQLTYLDGTLPSSFMFTRTGGVVDGAPAAKTAAARAQNVAGATPAEGYFQFNQAGIGHGFLIDNATPANTLLAQTQMLAFLLKGVVIDPTTPGPLAKPLAGTPALTKEILLPPVLNILGY